MQQAYESTTVSLCERGESREGVKRESQERESRERVKRGSQERESREGVKRESQESRNTEQVVIHTDGHACNDEYIRICIHTYVYTYIKTGIPE